MKEDERDEFDGTATTAIDPLGCLIGLVMLIVSVVALNHLAAWAFREIAAAWRGT